MDNDARSNRNLIQIDADTTPCLALLSHLLEFAHLQDPLHQKIAVYASNGTMNNVLNERLRAMRTTNARPIAPLEPRRNGYVFVVNGSATSGVNLQEQLWKIFMWQGGSGI